MANKQTGRHFGGNKKASSVGRGGAAAPSGGEIGRAAAIPPVRSAVKKGGMAKAKAAPKSVKKVSARRNS